MIKALVIIALVVGALLGGILTLRSSTRSGMPSDEVIDRARKRETELEAGEKEREDGD